MTVDVHAHALTGMLVEVCPVDDLSTERGAAALVGGEQVALFRTFDDVVYAVQQRDPYSGANVMSRGIVGTRGEIPTVASPMYKQVFDLRTGACLDSVGRDPRPLVSFSVVVRDGVVFVAGPIATGSAGSAGSAGEAVDVGGAGP